MGRRINTIMQTCFFAVSGVLPRDEAVAQIKKSIQKTYGKKGEEVVRRNFAAVDHTLAHLHEVTVPARATPTFRQAPMVPDGAPDFVKRVTALMMAGKGDLLPVSAFPVDGTWPVGTTKWEKRRIADEVLIWDPRVCILCNKCAMVCPHARRTSGPTTSASCRAGTRAEPLRPAAAAGRWSARRCPHTKALSGRASMGRAGADGVAPAVRINLQFQQASNSNRFPRVDRDRPGTMPNEVDSARSAATARTRTAAPPDP
jgi:ferredoxin